MMVREPVVAGSFYPADEHDCRGSLDRCFDGVSAAVVDGRIVGGVLPHAGWMCSGRIVARVFATIAAQRSPRTVVLLGAVHRVKGWEGAIFANGRWDTPLGSIDIDQRLADRILSHTNAIVDDPYAHEPEHSIEVEVPFVQRTWPEAKLLPIMVPPSERAAEIGDAVGRTLASYGYDAVVLASSDLTHYGERYRFTPEGRDERGLDWAKSVNDRRVIDLMLAMDAKQIVPETTARRNACGGGAIAATIAACSAMGADRAVLVEHATSRETMGMMREMNAVGYAGLVFAASAALKVNE
ncbi:MAG: AmmeMemoRadiSam system protein B [Phycisphaerales bacterium]|nr:AmmeMemoRadiSam system protein B [Phycisphaerales bacterium]